MLVRILIRQKGVNIVTEFDDFKDTLFNEKIKRHKMRRIQSKKHKLQTYRINKIWFSCFDDKRYVQDDSVDALLYFCKDVDPYGWSQIKIIAHKKSTHRW